MIPPASQTPMVRSARLKAPQLGQVSMVRPIGVPQLWQGRDATLTVYSRGTARLAALRIAAGGAEVAAFLADQGGLAAFRTGRQALALRQVHHLAQRRFALLGPVHESDIDHVLLDH